MAPHQSLGLDTEFMRERTYYAQLCLLQLGTADLAVCVDPLAIVRRQGIVSHYLHRRWLGQRSFGYGIYIAKQ